MSATYECVNRINSLKQSIEAETGKIYSNLTEAIQGLKDNGGSIEDFLNKFVKLHAFDGNNVIIPDTVTDLRIGAFAECYVGKVTLPETIDIIPTWCFYDTLFRQTDDATVILPDSLITIGREAFLSSGIRQITIPEGVTNINESAFYGCNLLTDITIPASVTTIGGNAFGSCPKLSTVTFNGTPTTFPSSLFPVCNKLTTINVPWSEGAVSGAPWGATKATINYNYTGG